MLNYLRYQIIIIFENFYNYDIYRFVYVYARIQNCNKYFHCHDNKENPEYLTKYLM